MLLTEDTHHHQYSIKQVSNKEVSINEDNYSGPIIIMPHKLIYPWSPGSFDALTIHSFSPILEENLEVVLLGIGETGRKISSHLYHALLEYKIVLETMSLAAACRTYAILSGENRSVAAALLFQY